MGNTRKYHSHRAIRVVAVPQRVSSLLNRVIAPGTAVVLILDVFFFFSSRRRHTRFKCDWSSDVCSSDLSARRRRAPWRRSHSRERCVQACQRGLEWFSPARFQWLLEPASYLRRDESEIGRASCRERV